MTEFIARDSIGSRCAPALIRDYIIEVNFTGLMATGDFIQFDIHFGGGSFVSFKKAAYMYMPAKGYSTAYLDHDYTFPGTFTTGNRYSPKRSKRYSIL